MIHFQPSQPTTIWMFLFFFSYPYSVFSTFYYETDHRKCEMTLGGWHCGLRLFKLGRPIHTGFEPRSLAWLACYTGQSATTYTTMASASQWLCTSSVFSLFSRLFQVLLHQISSRPGSLSPNDCYLFDKQSWCTIQYLIASTRPTDCWSINLRFRFNTQ